MKPPDFLKSEFDRFALHPSLLDGAFQTTLALLQTEENALFLPYNLKEAEILKPLEDAIYAYAVFGADSNSQNKSFDIKILNRKGEVLTALKDFSVRAAQAARPSSELRNLYFEPFWLPASGERENFSGRTLIFAERDNMLKAFQEKYPEGGHVSVKPGKAYLKKDGKFLIRADAEDDYLTLMEELAGENLKPEAVVYVSEFGSATLNVENLFHRLLYLLRALIKSGAEDGVRILCVYESGSKRICFDQAVGGLFKSAALERSGLVCQTLELDGSAGDRNACAKAAEELEFSVQAAEIRYRGEERLVKTFREFSPEKFKTDRSSFRREGIYLITGGLGGLGLITAQYLADKYLAKLVLAGRSELTPEKEKLLSGLKKTGGEAVYIQRDILDLQETENLVMETKKRFGGINGVIHCAGVIRDNLILNKSEAEIEEVLGAKLRGAINLDQALKDEKLDLMINFTKPPAMPVRL